MGDRIASWAPWAVVAMVAAGLVGAAYVVLSALSSPPAADDGRFTLADLAAVEIPAYDRPPKTLQLPEPGAHVSLPQSPLLDAAGETVTLAGYEGQVVLLNLWADWCPPCLAEMPSLDRLEAALGSEDFAVVPISLSSSREAGLDYYERAELAHLPFLHDETFANVARELRAANAMPITVLFDAEGRELGRVLGEAIWDSPEAQGLIQEVIAAGPGLR